MCGIVGTLYRNGTGRDGENHSLAGMELPR
jgi:hypothetical protein